jgi:transcriptional regulator with XRE-family HTH domain
MDAATENAMKKTRQTAKPAAAKPARKLVIPADLGVGISKVAGRLGVGRNHIYRVWRGERRSPRVEAALAALGVPLRRPGGE